MDSQYVTQRKNRTNTINNDSPNLSFISSNSDEYLSNSLPDLSTRHQCNEDIEIYKDEIQLLKKQLEIALAEIENIRAENCLLKEQTIEQDRVIVQLKKICPSSSYTPESTLRKNKQTQRNTLHNSCVDLTLKSDDERDESKDNITCSKNINIQVDAHQANIQTNLPLENNITISSISEVKEYHKPTSPEIQSRPQIIICGGQQLSGLASELIHSRMGSKYENYKVSALIKPNAETPEILKCCQNVHQSKDDYLILSVGENDVNPNKLLYELITIIKSLKNINIIIVNVCRNKSLNELMLNNLLKNICHNFENCRFLDIGLNVQYKKNFLHNACYKINLILDNIYYTKHFLTLKKNDHVQKSQNYNNQKQQVKGTIPYYFPIISKSQNPEHTKISLNTPDRLFRS